VSETGWAAGLHFHAVLEPVEIIICSQPSRLDDRSGGSILTGSDSHDGTAASHCRRYSRKRSPPKGPRGVYGVGAWKRRPSSRLTRARLDRGRMNSQLAKHRVQPYWRFGGGSKPVRVRVGILSPLMPVR